MLVQSQGVSDQGGGLLLDIRIHSNIDALSLAKFSVAEKGRREDLRYYEQRRIQYRTPLIFEKFALLSNL